MARRAERHQAVELEVRAPLGALDDVVDFEGTPPGTSLASPSARCDTPSRRTKAPSSTSAGFSRQQRDAI